jgi:hypothetical protein
VMRTCSLARNSAAGMPRSTLGGFL